jgi:hypothetical protein
MRTVILWILMITGPILATAQIDFEKFNGNYMRWRAQEGFIIADRFISPERSIAQGNYRYTEPEDGLLSFYYDNGYTSLRSEGQRDYLQIGIRAPQISIFERPPVHLAVALNANSYFELANQFDWISDALVSLSKGMRRQDRLSIAAMTSDGREDILLPLSLMHRQGIVTSPTLTPMIYALYAGALASGQSKRAIPNSPGFIPQVIITTCSTSATDLAGWMSFAIWCRRIRKRAWGSA